MVVINHERLEAQNTNKKGSYDTALKLSVVSIAEHNANKSAGRFSGVNERQVRDQRNN